MKFLELRLQKKIQRGIADVKFKDHRVAYYFDNNVFLYLDRSDLSEFISFNDSKTEDIKYIRQDDVYAYVTNAIELSKLNIILVDCFQAFKSRLS